MELPIPEKVKKLWDLWNLRVSILLSLFIQAFLVMSASSRQRYRNSFFIFLIWGAYLIADWIAAVAIGLTTKGQDDAKSCDHRNTKTKAAYDQDIAAFWASFLLLHLGGPDSITSFALEDNEFWVRHLFGLFLQALAAAYSFYLSLPDNKLWLPTVLVYIVGVVKYAERTRALYLASLDRFGSTALPKPEPGPDYEETSTIYASRLIQVPIQAEMTVTSNTGRAVEHSNDPDFDAEKINSADELKLLQVAYKLFELFKGLIVGFFLTTNDRKLSRDLFLKITDSKCAFRLIENELSFMFNVLHTKVVVTRNRLGYTLRGLSFCSLLGAFICFWLVEKKGFGRLEKIFTYTLLIGAIVLDAIAFVFKLILSDLNLIVLKNIWTKYVPQRFLKRKKWSKSVSQYNMIDYCLDERPKWIYKVADFFRVSGILDKIKVMWFSSSNKVSEDLEKFIFNDLKQKSEKADSLRDAEEACKQRGDYALLQCLNFSTKIKLKWSIGEFQYVESLLLWHIATEICHLKENYSTNTGDPENGKKKWWKLLWHIPAKIIRTLTKLCKFLWGKATKSICHLLKRTSSTRTGDQKKDKRICKVLSDYMFYLLIMQPNMLSTVMGNGYIAFQDTSTEAKRFFNKHSISNCSKALGKIIDMKAKFRPAAVKGIKSKSVFFDACILAQQLDRLDNERWDVMDRMWVELMCYSAVNCRPIIHAQQPSKGGELLTFTWLLMNHFGLGIQFSEQEEQAGTKMAAVK